ncbi:peptidoglycan-binding domain-containing protein [Ascidiaceihabitans sp.]|uniref:peptidoglycan-binding domain-containing protein n=2 Tax=Ascidiaceihabitans sp. TaxID=1872644 RepID=UPI003299CB93
MTRQFMAKTVGGAMIAAFAFTSTAEQASADLKDAIIGGIVVCGLTKCGQKKRSSGSRKTYKAPRKSGISSAQRQQNRDVQSSLNAFGFPVGTVDGSLGKRSRSAIRDYQGYMGYPSTGQLTDFERQTLVNGWQKFNAGAGNAYPRTMAALGPRGLLKIERDPNFAAQYGDNTGQAYAGNNNNNGQNGFNNNTGQNGYNNNNGQAAFANNGQNGFSNTAQTQNGNAQQPIQPLPKANQAGQVVAGAIPKLKPLQPIGKVAVSAASRCELVDQTTRIQGFIQASNMTDSNQALSEKFCEARGYAITQGGSVASQFQVSETELTSLCEQIQGGYAGVVATLPTAQEAQVVASSQSTAAQLGLTDPATTAAYGQICIGIGYRLDNAEMALSGALAMLAAGQAPYGEIVGHHLREGFGVAATPAAAAPWYRSAMGALEQGATPAFVPSTTAERVQVIRAALQLDQQRASGGGNGLPKLIPTAARLPALTVTKP